MGIREVLADAGISVNYTVIIGRCDGTQWVPMLLKDIDEGSTFPFTVWSPDGSDYGVEMIAPFIGNESALFTEDDVYGLWDYDLVRKYRA